MERVAAAARLLFCLALSIVVAGCASANLDPDDPGRISGTLMVFWIKEDGFIYYPLPKDPLEFRLPSRLAEELGRPSIRPGVIHTDGGSIPRPARALAGFSPWGYGPAYIVHDWLFVAKHCLVTGQIDRHREADREEARAVEKVSFAASAQILGAVIRALEAQGIVPKRDVAPGVIYGAVESVVARRLWDTTDPQSCSPPGAQAIRDIESTLGIGPKRFLAADESAPVLVYQYTF